jgi:hypothetical protein
MQAPSEIQRRRRFGEGLHMLLVLLACLAAVFPFYWMV